MNTTKSTRSAIIALMEDSEGSPIGSRFGSYDELYAWEEAHPEVFVSSVIRLVSRREALAEAKA